MVLAALARALVLCCNRSGDTGAVSFCHSWPHTSARVTGLQPLTLVSAHSHHARHWSHHGINGVDCTAPAVPPIGNTAQSDCVLQCPSVSCTHTPPLGQLPCTVCTGLFSALCELTSFPHLPSGEPPTTSWIFPVLHSYAALIPINPSVDPRVHCVVPLAQDRFLCRSSCRLRVGKAAKGVAPALSSETKCYAPAERCGVAQYFGQRETRTQRIPNQTPMHLGRCHNCASQRHPDTMHNTNLS